MNFKLISSIFIIFLLSTNLVQAQDSLANVFFERFEQNSTKHASEKLYLHLDKPYYAIGDDLWFKVYAIGAKTRGLSTISGVVNVELIDEKNTIVKWHKLPLRSGIAWGDFKLSSNLTEGNYRIRAYTQWMRNHDSSFFYDKTIKIGNSWSNSVFTKWDQKFDNVQQINVFKIAFADKQKKPYANAKVTFEILLAGRTVEKGEATTNSSGEINIASKNSKLQTSKFTITTQIRLPNNTTVKKEFYSSNSLKDIDVQFFPEGGHLVNGLLNKVGLKCIGIDGKGKSVKGKIIDEEGNELFEVETNKLGIGSFTITPSASKTYRLKFTDDDNPEKLVLLPLGEKSGTVISIKNTDTSKIFVKIFLTPDLLANRTYFFIAQQNGKIHYTTKINPTTQIISLTVPKRDLASGILQLSLLSSSFLPLNERVVFINQNSDKINIKLGGLSNSYPLRGKVDLKLNTEINNKPIQGSFSISVTNSSIVKPDIDNESNILTNLLLTSDLKGYVEEPNYYFTDNSIQRLEDLDNLLLTQGWRKVSWEPIIKAIDFPVEKNLQISGLLTSFGRPVPNGKIKLLSSNGGFFSLDTLSNASGNFIFDKIEFLDSNKFILQAKGEKNNKPVDIEMNVVANALMTENPNAGDIEPNINNVLDEYLKQSDHYFEEQAKRGLLSKSIVLDEVKITQKKTGDPVFGNLSWSYRADDSFTQEDFKNARSLKDFLGGSLSGVRIEDGQALAFSRKLLEEGGVDFSPKPMAVIVNGVNFSTNQFNLEAINVGDIESLEIFRKIPESASHWLKEGDGVITLTLKHGAVFNKSSGVINFEPKGFALTRTFYSPKYDIIQDDKPDLRNTVLWEPNLITTTQGEGNLSYFNTDVPGIYRIVVEGIDTNGNLARKVLTYEVK
jgi:hypothetical protein